MKEVITMLGKLDIDSLGVEIGEIAKMDATTRLFPFFLDAEKRNQVFLYNKDGLLIRELNVSPYSLLRALELKGVCLAPNGKCGIEDGGRALCQSWLLS